MKGSKALLVAAAATTSMLLNGLTATAAGAPLEGEGKNLELVANVAYSYGSDMEFATIKGREFAFAASWAATTKQGGGLHVIDVTNPQKPREVAWLRCVASQGDVQISHDRKTLMLASDSRGTPESCLMAGRAGFMTVDITDPSKPEPLGVAEIALGSHNITAHPTKPYIYNSDAQSWPGELQIWSIRNPRKPTLVNTVPVPGSAPHDISFNERGDLAIVAGIDTIDMFDTSDVVDPKLLSVSKCPGCTYIHDAKFTPDGSTVIVGDEGGGGGDYPCPGGALYFYEIEWEGPAPFLVLLGVYEPGEILLAHEGQQGPEPCTSHVFDISDDGRYVAISWYSAGTRYLDVSTYTGATFGGVNTPDGVVEVGYFLPEGGSSWSSKFHRGPYIYSNDVYRGFDVFKITTK